MKKITVIAAVVLVALLMLGVGFARWFDVLTINGTVNTGTVEARLTTDVEPVIEGDDKQVSSVSRSLSADGKTLAVQIDTAYPCVTYRIPFDVHSDGTIPIHVKPYVDWGDLPPVNPGSLTPAVYELNYIGGGTYDPVEGFVQLHEGEGADWEIVIHLDNDAEEGTTYNFNVDIDAGQYNEANEDPTP